MIAILSQSIMLIEEPPDPVYYSRTAKIYITDGTDAYVYVKGGLSDAGDLQALLNSMEAELYAEAAASGTVPTAKEQAKADRLIYLAANPNANLLFTTTALDLKTQIDTLVDVIFAGQTAGNRNKVKWLWNLEALVARESVAGE